MRNENVNNEFVADAESGRSMVEMLGTLAIIGVLSVGAIGGYSYAMNKHRTNELIYEATKRAQWVGTQLDMHNSNPSLAGFGSGELGGGTITGSILTNLPNNQIGIVVSNLKEGVCEGVKNSISENTVIRAIKNADATGDVTCEDNGTAALIFNKDLGTTDSTGSNDSGDQTGDDTGDDTNEETCELTASDCASGALAEGECACAPATNAQQCTSYTTNECGTGYFCLFSNPTGCDDNGQGTGTCTEIAGDYAGYQNTSDHWYEKTPLNWYSANSWCIGKGRPGLLTCDGTGTGYSCTGDDVAANVDGSDVPGLFNVLWLKNLESNNSCDAFGVPPNSPYVFNLSRNLNLYALCE